MRDYRRRHSRAPAKARAVPDFSQALGRILECVRNNVAINLNSCSATIWLITEDERVKNIAAFAELIVIEGLPQKG
jgi:hypothetical protein